MGAYEASTPRARRTVGFPAADTPVESVVPAVQAVVRSSAAQATVKVLRVLSPILAAVRMSYSRAWPEISYRRRSQRAARSVKRGVLLTGPIPWDRTAYRSYRPEP